jgi:hypothetical protein
MIGAEVDIRGAEYDREREPQLPRPLSAPLRGYPAELQVTTLDAGFSIERILNKIVAYLPDSTNDLQRSFRKSRAPSGPL